MKVIFVLNIFFILYMFVLTQNKHNYGKGHGGGHGIYGYPVGRKWSYSTQIKHPAPKYYGHYGSHVPGFGGPGYGGQSNGGQGFGGHGFRPNYGYELSQPKYGQGYSQTYRQEYPGFTHGYGNGYNPYGYSYGRNRREGGLSSQYPVEVEDRHKNHNYGPIGYGAHSKTYDNGYRNSGLDDITSLDFLGKYL